MLSFSLLALVATCLAAPTLEQRQLSPSVTIKNGTVVGSSDGVIDSFKGIPFAQPPVGNLRLRPPQIITKSYGTTMLPSEPSACPQQFTSGVNTTGLGLSPFIIDLLDNITSSATGPSGEDCLTVNVQRPAGTTAGDNLPVLFWIYGGGFEFGSTQTYDATGILTKAITLGKPMVYVAVNYRVSGFGFLAGKELQKEGSTNLGLRDQRMGLEWVADNIAAFGGDPSKVTIWGESAGSISVFDQLIINNGNNNYHGKPLFRGAIMDSGSVIPSLEVSSPKAQAVYDSVVAVAGCSSAKNTVTCLRNLSYDDFMTAVNSQPAILSYSSVDLAYLPRPDPNDNFFPVSPDEVSASNGFVKVPIIIGDQQDEGTLFSLFQTNISTTDELVDYFAAYFPETPRHLVASLVATYPDNPAAGSPFGTGSANELYPQFKRLAALIGDATFTLTRRAYLSHAAAVVPAWSYLNTYLHGTPFLGTFHATDIFTNYYDVEPFAGDAFQTYYTSFVYYLNPNTISTTFPLVEWPQWTNSDKHMLNFSLLEITPLTDNFRQQSYEYLLAHQHDFKV